MSPISDFSATFQRSGLRLTHQRLEIFRTLLADREHPSAEKLYAQLRRKLPTISLDTVYRNLHTMEEHGLVQRVFTENSQARFEARREPHHHLLCRRCGLIMDVAWKAFDQLDLPEMASHWGLVESRQATLRGVCQSCLDQSQADQGQQAD